MTKTGVSITGLSIYPIKSLPGISVSEALYTPKGFEHDRMFMLVDEKGNMVTLRDFPNLADFSVSRRGIGVTVTRHGVGAMVISLQQPEPGELPEAVVIIHRETSWMLEMGIAYDKFFSECLGMKVRLMRSIPWHERTRHSTQMGCAIPLHAQDGYPAMILSQASHDQLTHRLIAHDQSPASMERFRPNIVIGGTEAHEEDTLAPITFGDSNVFDRVKLCSRCRAIEVHTDRGSSHFANHDPNNEPMRTLATYRRVRSAERDGKIYFGVNAVPKGSGTLSIGMPVSL